MTDNIDRAATETQNHLDWQINSIIANQATNQANECIDCGGLIGTKRKQAMPSAIRCIGCQWQFERTHDRR